MKVLFDLNILMDVLQHREEFYDASAKVLSKSLKGECTGIIPEHAVTTLHYLLSKYANELKANDGIDFLLEHFDVVCAQNKHLRKARSLPMKDFEDAVVASIAKQSACKFIITRNISDFKKSPVEALLPEEFLKLF